MNGAPHRIVLAAGGTGGHVFPAQALAAELSARGHALALITDRRGRAYGDALGRIETHRVSAARIEGGVAGRLRGVVELGCGFFQSRRLLGELAPRAVVGFGGYPSVPVMLAASRAGLPTLIHEQNAVLGRANRLLAGRVTRIATSFAAVKGIRPQDAAKVVLTGAPVRPDIAALARQPWPPLDGRLRVLVLGGSQGARILSEVIPAAVARLAPLLRARLAIAQQCRPEDLESVRGVYAQCGADVELATFFNDVPQRLAAAHLFVGRAGASTCAEITAAGRPAVLVPYLHATDDHQTANARAIEAAGAAWVMPQDRFTPEALAARLEALLAEPALLAEAAAKARAIGKPDAAARLADAVEAIAGGNGTVRRAAA